MVKSSFRSNRKMAATYQLRARIVGGELDAANARGAALISKARDEAIDQTIYQRRPLRNAERRRLTGNLKRSEQMQRRGNTFVLTNTADYAAIRLRMKGRSKLFGFELESNWPARGRAKSAPARRMEVRRALDKVWRQYA